MSRTDLHRPSVMIPADYDLLTVYWSARYTLDGECIDEGYGIDEASAIMADAVASGQPVYGSIGRCGSCGARYITGALYEHRPTGELLNVGHDCADKMYLTADWTASELAAKRAADRRAASLNRLRRAAEAAAFLAQREGLEDALTATYTGGRQHHILRDLSAKLAQWGSLSEAQTALAYRLAEEVREANSRPVEVLVSAPTGRVTIRGRVVGLRAVESMYGVTLKATVRVPVDGVEGGVWYCWLTVPGGASWTRGDTVAVKATVERSDREGWGFGKRPAVA
jgi:hypothetical protein